MKSKKNLKFKFCIVVINKYILQSKGDDLMRW